MADVQGTLPFDELGPELDRLDLPQDPIRVALGGYDVLGRKQPHRMMSGYSLFHHIMRLAPIGYIRTVPHQAIDRSEEAPIVRCPCGVNCIVPYDTWHSCSGCERNYVSAPSHVWVIYGEMVPPAIKSD